MPCQMTYCEFTGGHCQFVKNGNVASVTLVSIDVISLLWRIIGNCFLASYFQTSLVFSSILRLDLYFFLHVCVCVGIYSFIACHREMSNLIEALNSDQMNPAMGSGQTKDNRASQPFKFMSAVCVVYALHKVYLWILKAVCQLARLTWIPGLHQMVSRVRHLQKQTACQQINRWLLKTGELLSV